MTKNLSDPTKSSDPKYRQLKLDNEKVKSKILTCHAAVPLLVALGFADLSEDGVEVLRIDESNVNHAALGSIFNEIVSTLTQLDGVANNQNKKPKLNKANSSLSTSSTTSAGMIPGEKVSEKQKARMLLEEKERADKEAAKAHRKKNVALLKVDKHVRQNDENWTSAPSAACAKTGNSISTFRDKYGEGE